MILKSLLILLSPNDADKPYNLALSHPLTVVLSPPATVKTHLIGNLPGILLIFPFKLVTDNHFAYLRTTAKAI